MNRQVAIVVLRLENLVAAPRIDGLLVDLVEELGLIVRALRANTHEGKLMHAHLLGFL